MKKELISIKYKYGQINVQFLSTAKRPYRLCQRGQAFSSKRNLINYLNKNHEETMEFVRKIDAEIIKNCNK